MSDIDLEAIRRRDAEYPWGDPKSTTAADRRLLLAEVTRLTLALDRANSRAIPRIPFPGGTSDAAFYRSAASHLQRGYPVGGSNLTAAVVDLLRRTANHLDTLDGTP